MSCTATLTNITLGCLESMGGIKTVYIANRDDFDVALDTTGSQIDEIALKTGITGKKFYTLEIQKQTGSMTSTMTSDATNGVQYVTTDVNLQFKKMETANRIALAGTASAKGIMGANMIAVVKDQNDKYWFLGLDNPVTCSAGTGETGTNFGDANQYTCTLQDMSRTFPYELSDDAITDLISFL